MPGFPKISDTPRSNEKIHGNNHLGSGNQLLFSSRGSCVRLQVPPFLEIGEVTIEGLLSRISVIFEFPQAIEGKNRIGESRDRVLRCVRIRRHVCLVNQVIELLQEVLILRQQLIEDRPSVDSRKVRIAEDVIETILQDIIRAIIERRAGSTEDIKQR